MTIIIDEIDDRELERRLRATFAAVMPLLDPPAATVGEDGDGREELAAIGVIALDPSVRRPHRRRLVTPLTVLSAAAIIVLLLAVRTRAVAPGTATSNASAVPATTAASAPVPRWYQVLRPLLPDGFDQIVVTGASAEALSFRALRTSTGHVLDVVLGRGPGDLKDGPDVAKNTDGYGTWFASTSAVALATTDGRYVSLTCGIVMDRGAGAAPFSVGALASHRDICDDGVDRDVIGGSARWKIVAALAERLTPDIVDVAFGGPIRASDASTVETRVREVIPGLPEIGRSIRSDGVIEHFPLALGANEPGLTTLSVVPGVYPPRAADDNPAFALAPMADPVNRTVIYDGVAIGWIVDRNGTGYHVETTDTSDSNRRRMGAVLERLAFAAETKSSTPSPVRARTGTYGAGGEVGTSELIRLGAPDAAAVLAQLGANVSLPPGGTFDEFIAKRTKDAGVEAEDGLRATLELVAACKWTAYWLDAQRAGNAAAMAEAQAALDAVPDRASLVATDGGGVTEAWQRIADATRAGDPAKVGPAGYTASCASPGHA